MILGTLAEAARYNSVHPAFARAFEFLRTADLASLGPGRHEVDGEPFFLLIDQLDGRGHAGARVECHRAHIDIQMTIEGTEQIGWMPLSACSVPDGTFDESTDLGFFVDRPVTWLELPPRVFAVFFPEDAHAPLGGSGALKKVIVKIRV
jgi:biofilm protein TabA